MPTLEKEIISPVRWARILKSVRNKGNHDILEDFVNISFQGISIEEALQAINDEQVSPNLTHYEFDQLVQQSSFSHKEYQLPTHQALQIGPDASSASTEVIDQEIKVISAWFKIPKGTNLTLITFGTLSIVLQDNKLKVNQGSTQKAELDYTANIEEVWTYWEFQLDPSSIIIKINDEQLASTPMDSGYASANSILKLSNHIDGVAHSAQSLYAKGIAVWTAPLTPEISKNNQLHGIDKNATDLHSFWPMTNKSVSGNPAKLSTQSVTEKATVLTGEKESDLAKVNDFVIPWNK